MDTTEYTEYTECDYILRYQTREEPTEYCSNEAVEGTKFCGLHTEREY